MFIESREAHIWSSSVVSSISSPITNMSKNCDRIKMFNNGFSPFKSVGSRLRGTSVVRYVDDQINGEDKKPSKRQKFACRKGRDMCNYGDIARDWYSHCSRIWFNWTAIAIDRYVVRASYFTIFNYIRGKPQYYKLQKILSTKMYTLLFNSFLRWFSKIL